MLKQIFNFLIELLFPKFCVSCGKFDTFFCKQCFSKVKPFKNPVKLDLPGQVYLDQVLAAAVYAPPIDQLIHELKYQSVKDIGLTCARIINYLVQVPAVDIITYVPLHQLKQSDRGFNQAQVIASELSRLTNIPCANLLKRTVNTSPQARVTSREERLNRMANIFKANSVLNPPFSILLVDDVTTTGSTLNECAKVLKQVGVKKVIGLVVAHGS